MSRVRELWASVRPRTRRGGFLAAFAILAGAAALSVALFVGAAMAWNPYLDFSLHQDVNARQWASLDESFASSGICVDCHAPEAARAASASHAGIGCQSCHGPLLGHTLANPEAAGAMVAIAVPTDEVCVRCHVQADGRPAGQQQIVPADHYVSTCLDCHDPHTAIAMRPPVVLHPLAKLPPCLTCHGPEGFKQRNQRHPAGTNDDQQCLECHAKGRGPADDQVSP
jgi:Cytochrome c554 and c-prime